MNTQHIEKFFDLVNEEGRTANEAALITGINVRTAQNYIRHRTMTKKDVCPVFKGSLVLNPVVN